MKIHLDYYFDLLGKLRQYDTSTRESTFSYEGSKRLGDYDDYDEEWKRYHWCKTHLLGYEDDTNTYYIVPDITGSTKIIIDSNSVVNRLDYDHLGYIRNKTTDPQVELLWRTMYYNILINTCVDHKSRLYFPNIGYGLNYIITDVRLPLHLPTYPHFNGLDDKYSDHIISENYNGLLILPMITLMPLLGCAPPPPVGLNPRDCWYEYDSNCKSEYKLCCPPGRDCACIGIKGKELIDRNFTLKNKWLS